MYYTKGPGSNRRRAGRDKQLLQTVFARVLDKPIHDLDDIELQLIVDGWQSPSTASLAVRLIRPCLKWAGKRGYAPPKLATLEQPKTVAKRERVLTTDELKSIWPHLNGVRGDVIKWLLWTGCRLGEATGLQWAEIHGDKWVLPAARTKNGRQRVIPLSRQPMDLLATLNPRQPDALIFASTGGRALSNWDKSTKMLHAQSGTTGWHRHDLRRSVATMLGDLGFPPHIIGAVLGHAHIAEGATAIHARSRYLPEHREALQVLADEIDRIVSGADNVVRLVGRR
jgi:integrase